LTSAWTFAVAAWGRPGVEAICLDLQNVHDQCPALLLWRLWTLEENRAVDSKGLARAVTTARGWDIEVLRPLRAIRQRLAAPSGSVADAAREVVRRRLLDAELEAEHALVEALEGVQTPGAGGAPQRLRAMIDLAEAWRPPAPSATLARLIEAL
jgi:uncharacterized protein (TIGR02444 family)